MALKDRASYLVVMLAGQAAEAVAVALILNSLRAGAIYFLSVSFWWFGLPIYVGLGHFPWWVNYITILNWLFSTLIAFAMWEEER